MSNILNKANGISLSGYQDHFRATSTTGFARTEINAPAFYNVGVTLPPMYEAEFRLIQQDIMTMRYGAVTITTTIPHGHTTNLGTAGITDTVTNRAAVTSGRVINLTADDEISHINITALGDWLQFQGADKVYQVVESYAGHITNADRVTATQSVHTDSAGRFTVVLNTPLVAAIAANNANSFGDNVQFKLQMEQSPEISTTPGQGGKPLYTISDLDFKEVL